MKGFSICFKSSYNNANSPFVGIVKEINEINKHEKEEIHVPIKGIPNSVTVIKDNNGTLQERYYNEKGDAYLDIDYSNHGNPKMHPEVPHIHHWIKDEKGNLIRKRSKE